ncbi:MAG: hypothetical protein ACK55I_27570, partial [bacterium]
MHGLRQPPPIGHRCQAFKGLDLRERWRPCLDARSSSLSAWRLTSHPRPQGVVEEIIGTSLVPGYPVKTVQGSPRQAVQAAPLYR